MNAIAFPRWQPDPTGEPATVGFGEVGLMADLLDLTAIVLTLNERKHIERCIKNLACIARRIIVVDSLSTDGTPERAKELGADVFEKTWVNYATQFNWALDNCDVDTKWVLRLDADEYLTESLVKELHQVLPTLSDDVAGIYVKRRVYFKGKFIRFGGYYPTYLLRIWRNGMGRCEHRWMDEHIKLSVPATIALDSDIVDENLNNITWWTNKHNSYATREAVDLLNQKYRFLAVDTLETHLFEGQAQRKRWIKEHLYSRLPLGLRALAYFLYRYLLNLGFLDGAKGTVFHFLQGFWYRLLVDIKVSEIEEKILQTGESPREIIEREYGFRF